MRLPEDTAFEVKSVEQEKLTPEEFVQSLYRILLDREPDREGFTSHVKLLKKTRDKSQIVNSFLKSKEYKEKHVTPVPELPPFDVETVLEASRRHFRDIDFIYKLRNVKNLAERKKREVRTIAIYYHRLHDGGTERVTAWQITAWVRMGYNVVLLADEPRNPNDYPYPAEVERIVIPAKLMWGDHGEYFERGRALAGALKQCNPDLFITNLTHEICTIWDVLVAKSLNIPAIIGWHNVFDASFHDGSYLDLARLRLYGYHYADLIYVLSDMDRLWYSVHGISARVIRNAPTFDTLPETPSTVEGKTIVWVARAERHQKRLDHAIQMLPLVLREHPDAELLIVGGGPDLDWGREIAKVLGVASRVRFAGYATDVQPYLRSGAVHLMTSQFEGYPLALEEAWSFGLPTVMYEMPYLEMVKPGKGFIPVPQADLVALAAAVSKLLGDETLRKKMGADARAASEELRRYSVEGAWRQVFEDVATADELGEQADASVNSYHYTILVKHLSEKLFPVPKPSLQAPISGNPRHYFDRWLESVELKSAPARYGSGARPLAPLKTIDLTQIPLGDNLMLWTGLYTLLDHDLPVAEFGCRLHTHQPLVKLGRALFGRFGIEVVAGRPQDIKRPYYTPHPPKTMKEAWRAYFGTDWYMDWVEATDRQKIIPRPHVKDRLWDLLRISISERVIYKRRGWKSATPGYNGYRVWWPLALRLGVKPVVFYSMMCQSLQSIRKITADYVDALTASSDTPVFTGCAAFPTGNSYQTIDADSYEQIMSNVGEDKFTCFIQEDSPWRDTYIARGIRPTHLASVEDTFKVIRNAKTVFTCCSFTSHVAQLLRDDFVLAMFKDFPANNVHPGARPALVTSIPACAPCNYLPRENFKQCPAGYDHCCALDDIQYRRRIASELKLRCG